MRFKSRRNTGNNTEISMLNLIDVIFMLLIFFMLATTFNNYGQFNLTVPKVDTKKLENDKENKMLEVIVDKNRKYYLKFGENQKEIAKKDLEKEISNVDKIFLENVKITADENLEYKIIMEVMSELKNQNVRNVSLNLQKAE